MAYTAATARSRVREFINEDTADFWTDTEIDEWIKMGCLDISTKTLVVKHRDYFTLATDTEVYDASDFNTNTSDVIVGVQYAWYQDDMNAVSLQKIRPDQFGHVQFQDAGPPKMFFEDNGEIFVWPVPTSSENGNKINLIYAYASDDITDLRYNYQIMAIWFAVSIAKAKDEQFGQASMWQQVYANALQFERNDKFDKGIERAQSKRLG